MKRFIAVFLSLLLVVSLLPTIQAAANDDIPFDSYGVRGNNSVAYAQLAADDEWETFPRKSNVLLTEERTIHFSDIATPSKIEAITIEHNNQLIPVRLTYTKSDYVKVNPVQRFLAGQNYTLKVLLKNGKKYKMNFTTTKTGVDKEPNNTYKQASTLYLDETIHGTVSKADPVDFFKISELQKGHVDIQLKRLNGNNLSLFLYDENGDEGELLAYDEDKTVISLQRELKSGTYYLQVTGDGGYELGAKLTPKDLNVAEALQLAQDAVNALPAPIDVTEKHREAIGKASELIDNAKEAGADPLAIERMEKIITNLLDVIEPVEMTAVNVFNSTTFEVRFNRSVDASVALFEVTDGTVKKVTFNANRTVAKVEMAEKFTAGTKTISVKGLTMTSLTAVFIAEAERVASVDIIGDKATRVAGNFVTIAYKVLNQYGEEMPDAVVTVKATGTVVSTTPKPEVAKGVVKVPIQGTVQEGDEIELKLEAGGKSITKTIKVSMKSSVRDIKIKGLYPEDKKLKETTNLAEEKFYLLVDVLDQHGDPITDIATINIPDAIKLTSKDPTVVGFAATSEFEDLGNGRIGLRLTGSPKAGETEVTLKTAAGEGKYSSYLVKVAEGPRTDDIQLIVPDLVTEDRDLSIEINARDKEGQPINDLDILTSKVSGISWTIEPNIFYEVKQDDNDITKFVIKFSASNIIAGTLKITALSSTKKITEKVIEVKGKIEPKSWKENAIKTVIDLSQLGTGDDGSQKIDTNSITILDQYGDKMKALPPGYGIIVKDENSTGGAVSVKDNIIKPIAVGTEKVKISLSKDDTMIAGSEKEMTFTVTDGNYIAYEVAEIGTIYDEVEAGKTDNKAYDKPVVVYGILSDNTKVKLTHGVDKDYTVTAVNPTLNDDLKDGVLNVDTTTQKYAYENANTITPEIIVTINSSREQHKQKITISKVRPEVRSIVTQQKTIAFNQPNEGFDIEKLVMEATDIVATDQYGVKSLNLTQENMYFKFPDGTQVEPAITFTTVNGNHLFINNGTKNAKVTDFTANSVLSAVIKVDDIQSKQVLVTLKNEYMPSVKTETDKVKAIALEEIDNSKNVLIEAQKLVGSDYIVTIKSSENKAIAIDGKVTQLDDVSTGNVVFTVTHKSMKALAMDTSAELSVEKALQVILAQGSLGVIGDKTITNLPINKKYIVTDGSNYYAVLANGMLSESQGTKELAEEKAMELTTGTIIGLTNGKTYKVELVEAKEVNVTSDSIPDAIAGDRKITGLPSGKKYIVIEGTKYYGVLANGTLSASQDSKEQAEALAAFLTGASITGLTNGVTYKIVEATPLPLTGVKAVAGNGMVTVTFPAPFGATSVKLEQSMDGVNWTEVAIIPPLTATSTSATVSGLTNGETYYFQVVVVGGAYDGTSNMTTGVTPVASITLKDITGVEKPITGGVPVGTIVETSQYTATVEWNPNHSTFQANTEYKATIIITPKKGFTLTGIAKDFFRVTDAKTVKNDTNSGIVTVTFNKTAEASTEE